MGEAQSSLHQPYRCDLLDGLRAALAEENSEYTDYPERTLKAVPAKRLIDAIRASVSEPVKEAPAKKAGAKEASATKPAAAKKPAPVKKTIAKKPAAAKKSPAAKKPVAKTAAAKKSPAAKKK